MTQVLATDGVPLAALVLFGAYAVLWLWAGVKRVDRGVRLLNYLIDRVQQRAALSQERRSMRDRRREARRQGTERRQDLLPSA